MKEQQTLKKVFSYMEEYHMLKKDDQVVVGVSGGADSVCLLFVLLAYARRVPIRLSVVHVNHLIREEAGRDASYVKTLCEEFSIPFYLYEEDVERFAGEKGISTEEAGRLVRYNAFEEVAQKCMEESDAGSHSVKIAVAHNENDQAETMLFHLFRGSGLKGMSGIRPVRDNIIRPLLCLERQEIEDFLSDIGRDFCMDHTNEEDDYTRNRIRHHILPLAEKEIVSGAIGHMGACAVQIAEAEDYLQIQTKGYMEKIVRREEAGKVFLLTQDFETLHPFMKKSVLFQLITDFSPQKKDISSVHVKLLEQLFVSRVGSRLDLPFEVSAVKEYDRVSIFRREEKNINTQTDNLPMFVKDIDEELQREAVVKCEFLNNTFTFQLLEGSCSSKKADDIPQNQYTKWFDYDKINGLLMLRTRQPKDRLTILREGNQVGHKALKDYLITEKIPKQERDTIPVLAVGSDIVWLVGYRIGESFKVDESTKHILQVQCDIAEKGR